jgi:GNAT superfamily N-acetyltransferase
MGGSVDRGGPRVDARIRAARPEDIEAMRSVENDAGERFRTIGLGRVADDDPPEAALLRRHIDEGTAWVAEADAAVVGYAIASVVDGEGHLDQVSVREAAMGRGTGGALVETVAGWAAAAGLPTLTLTTYADVPWNGPWYARRGFLTVSEADAGPELRAILAAERAAGLEPPARIAMRRTIEGGSAER